MEIQLAENIKKFRIVSGYTQEVIVKGEEILRPHRFYAIIPPRR